MFWRFVCKLSQNWFCCILTDHRGPGDRGFENVIVANSTPFQVRHTRRTTSSFSMIIFLFGLQARQSIKSSQEEKRNCEYLICLSLTLKFQNFGISFCAIHFEMWNWKAYLHSWDLRSCGTHGCTLGFGPRVMDTNLSNLPGLHGVKTWHPRIKPKFGAECASGQQ